MIPAHHQLGHVFVVVLMLCIKSIRYCKVVPSWVFHDAFIIARWKRRRCFTTNEHTKINFKISITLIITILPLKHTVYHTTNPYENLDTKQFSMLLFILA